MTHAIGKLPEPPASAAPAEACDEEVIVARIEAAKARYGGLDITDVPDDVMRAFLRGDMSA